MSTQSNLYELWAADPDPEAIKKRVKPGEQLSKHGDSTDWSTSMFGGSYNPDELGYEDYQAMLKDPQVKTGISFLINALLSKKYILTPTGEDTLDQEIELFVRTMIDSMQIPLRRVRKDLYSAISYGYSVAEVIYDYDEASRKIIVDRIKCIDIETLEDCFNYDDYGNLEGITQTVGEETIDLPVEKCLVYSFDEEFGNKYGQSILSQVYDNYYMKKQILKWYMVYIQKHEGPTLMGKAGPDTSADDLLDQLDGIKEGRQNMVVDQEDDVRILESSHRGEAFMTAITYHDTVIFRRFMIGSLIFGQAEASGSYAQSQTHMDSLKLFLDGLHEEIAAIFQELIKRVVDLNFNTERYPTFTFEPFTEKELLALFHEIKPLAEKFIVDPASEWFRQLISMIVEHYGEINIDWDEEDKRLEEKMQQMGMGGGTGPPGVRAPTDEEQGQIPGGLDIGQAITKAFGSK